MGIKVIFTGAGRDIVDVINQMKPIFVEQKLSTNELDSIISSAEFSAPENDKLFWERLQEVLLDVVKSHISDGYESAPEWVKQLSRILRNAPNINNDDDVTELAKKIKRGMIEKHIVTKPTSE